jgi:predicted nucleotidyltransferase
MTMLDLANVDLRALADAMEDNSLEFAWCVDPRTGEVVAFAAAVSEQPGDDMIPIEPLSSPESYADMELFVERVRDARARDLLSRAIQGRGAFRRFKDTLIEFPELRSAWFAFHDARMQRRALRWLAHQGLINELIAERAAANHPDPDLPELGIRFDPEQIARDVAADLRELYGERLRRVILFGSWARGDAHPESDIDLLVVLRDMRSPWAELRRMNDVAWHYSYANNTVLSTHPVDEKEFEEAATPLLRRVRVEGRLIA